MHVTNSQLVLLLDYPRVYASLLLDSITHLNNAVLFFSMFQVKQCDIEIVNGQQLSKPDRKVILRSIQKFRGLNN
jgi:hypothetical protein